MSERMNADELRALRDDCKRRAYTAWTDEHADLMRHIAAALEQAASDRATLERVRAIPAKVDERGRLYIAEADLDAALRDEQEVGSSHVDERP